LSSILAHPDFFQPGVRPRLPKGDFAAKMKLPASTFQQRDWPPPPRTLPRVDDYEPTVDAAPAMCCLIPSLPIIKTEVIMLKPVSLLFACCLFGASSAYAQSAPIKLCYEDSDNAPWLIKGGQGLNNVLLDMAAAKSNVKIEQVALPWKRCLDSLASGAVAGAIGASFTAERAAYATYPTTADGKPDPARRIKTDGYSLYRQKGTSANWDGKQFSQLTTPIGVQLGYSVVGDLKKLGVAVDEGRAEADTVMKKLLAGRIQLGALQTTEGDELLKRPEFGSKIEKLPLAFTEKPYFVIFNKEFFEKNKAGAEALWNGLAQARESKEFASLLKEKTKK
jgi:polar amino acid transport system substrate-binding protein